MRAPVSLLMAACLLGGTSLAWGADPSGYAKDHRIPVDVTEAERNQVLEEMRNFLHSLFNIHNALARKDMPAVAKAAKPLVGALGRFPPKMEERLPVAFLEMSHGMHEIFNVMARDAETRADVSHSLGQVAEALTYCSGCHDTYRFRVTDTAVRRGGR